MDIRSQRRQPLSFEEVELKLNSTNPKKPGEWHEWSEALRESHDKFTPQLASEVADLVYYANQPNYKNNPNQDFLLYLTLGDNYREISNNFCVIKYNARLKYGDLPNHKEIENMLLLRYLVQLSKSDDYFRQ